MKRYLNLDLQAIYSAKGDLSGLFPPEIQKIHVQQIQIAAMEEIERNLQEDEDLHKEDLIEA